MELLVSSGSSVRPIESASVSTCINKQDLREYKCICVIRLTRKSSLGVFIRVPSFRPKVLGLIPLPGRSEKIS